MPEMILKIWDRAISNNAYALEGNLSRVRSVLFDSLENGGEGASKTFFFSPFLCFVCNSTNVRSSQSVPKLFVSKFAPCALSRFLGTKFSRGKERVGNDLQGEQAHWHRFLAGKFMAMGVSLWKGLLCDVTTPRPLRFLLQNRAVLFRRWKGGIWKEGDRHFSDLANGIDKSPLPPRNSHGFAL